MDDTAGAERTGGPVKATGAAAGTGPADGGGPGGLIRLTDPIRLAGRTAPARVIFGPHETNLGRDREISDRHVAYYARRAAGGAGLIVTETASVTADDHPYERAPLAELCEPGWAAVAAACRPHGTLVLAGLGHAGGQGSSAFSQSVLWAPSAVADAVSRELPAVMEQPQIDAVVAGFADAARRAVRAGLDGVELDAGAYSLLRQFQSGLTNLRGDDYGSDRLRLTREVLAAVRAAIGGDRILALRLSCDELAPWAGVTPEQAAEQVAALSGSLDLLVVVRGGPYSTSAYRPDGHTPPLFNLELSRAMREAAGGRVPVALQGSVVDTDAAQIALDEGAADLVEMTRAQIAEPRLVGLLRDGVPERARPCVLCNQVCRVRDNRNPIVSCIGDPRSGHETEDGPADGLDAGSLLAYDRAAASPQSLQSLQSLPSLQSTESAGTPERPEAPETTAVTRQPEVVVVGAGPAGLECARVLASLGHRVRLAEATGRTGGALRDAAAGGQARERMALLADWLDAECRRLGVDIALGTEVSAGELAAMETKGTRAVVLATGARPGPLPAPTDRADTSVTVTGVRDLYAGGPDGLPPGRVVVYDPAGGPVAVAAAEWLAAEGREVLLVTPDQTAGTMLALTGDLADANTRLQRAGVERVLRSRLGAVGAGRIVVEHVWTGEQREIPCAVVVHCGFDLPEESLYLTRPGTPRAGDCVAPRTVYEAVLEGRRRALEIAATAPPLRPHPPRASPAPTPAPLAR